jgi:hypothetical protein
MVGAFLLCGAFALPAAAEAEMPGLDRQVQEIKSDVLAIATELQQLEEELLYPSNTQVAVFVSLGESDGVALDSVSIEIDGEPAARHVYSFKEVEALQKGGVQRLYTGNVGTGVHRLDVSVKGTSGGSPFDATETFSFEKAVEPRAVALTIARQSVGDPRIEIGGL